MLRRALEPDPSDLRYNTLRIATLWHAKPSKSKIEEARFKILDAIPRWESRNVASVLVEHPHCRHKRERLVAAQQLRPVRVVGLLNRMSHWRFQSLGRDTEWDAKGA